MAGTFTAVDLSRLPAPDLVEALDFETILQEVIADLQARDPVFSALVESDPAYKVAEAYAYREVLIRQRVNEAARATMLAEALGADLDQIGAFYNVSRLVAVPGDPDAIPPVPDTMETDADFRRRIQLAFEGFASAGPVGAYLFHALSADGDVKDVSVQSPSPGDVLVTVLSRTGDGQDPGGLAATVESALSAEDVRPLTDFVTVQGATIQAYTIDATLYFYDGPDKALVMAAAREAIEAYTEDQHALGRDITLSGIYQALHRPGVQRVELAAPASTIVVDPDTAAHCPPESITLTDGGLDE